MATSGTYVFDATTDQILTSSLRTINVLSEEQVLSDLPAAVTTNARFKLNVMLKGLEAEGMPLWAISEMSIPYSYFSGNSVSIGPGLTIDSAAPLKLLQAQSYDSTTSNSLSMTVMTRYDYNELSSSNSSTGNPVNVLYIPQTTTGVLSVWPAPSGGVKNNGRIIITYQRSAQDVGIGTNTLDFPPYWTDPIIIGLAWRLAPEYGVPTSERAMLKADYMQLKMDALGFGTEEGSYKIMPDWSNRG